MPSGTPLPNHPPSPSSSQPSREPSADHADALITSNQSTQPNEEIFNSRLSGPPLTIPSTTGFSPLHTVNESDSASSGRSDSRPNSLHGGRAPSIISDSDESESSLGGLNHVNDGVGGSTAQRRMSRAFSSEDTRRITPRHFPVENLRRSATDDNLALHHHQQPQQRRPRIPLRTGSRLTSSLVADGDLLSIKRESCWKPWLRRKVPLYGWLISPGYSLTDMPDDVIAGLTISTVVIPQSMAYAMLAPLPPVYGLYTSVVPILIYCIFGTSRHMHTGTFAITTLLLGQAVRGLMANEGGDFNLARTLFHSSVSSPSDLLQGDPEYEQKFISTLLMLTFVVGFIQVIMSFLRVGGWASRHLLPDALVGGFNTAAVFHIGTSQLRHFLGLKGMPSSQGAFALIRSWVERKRKAKHELQMKRKRMFMVQQRQAVSAAVVREHEARREERQRLLQQQQRESLKSDGGIRLGTSTALRQPPLSPYVEQASPDARTSNISLWTMDEENGQRDQGSSTVLASTTTGARTLDEVEQALPDTTANTQVEERDIYIPIPDILLAVILLTLLNVFFALDRPRSEGGWGIGVIGSIPKGFPDIIFPPNRITTGPEEWMTLDFVKRVLLPMFQSALLIAVVIYVMSFSIAKQFGKRYGYKVDPNQEMLALGLASMGGSIFSGYACTGSLTRTAILSQSGGRTPLASIVGVIVVGLTLVSLTWCFERVPNTVLAGIVLVALQSLVMQITEPLKLLRLGQRKNAIIWMVTFVGVLIVSVELGIAIGIFVVLLTTAYSWIQDRRRLRGPRRHDRIRRSYSQGTDDATESLLSSASPITGSGGETELQRRRTHLHLSEEVSPASRSADWKRRMMRTGWGQRIGSFFGMKRPMLTDTLQTNTDDDDYRG
ncbi:hypothetical protein BG011_000314 [Mortierella polycephala]|uniref:SLC26A/SulP transporter domain-containing protein n=1 Tax=Mortierella polycephala TaxID=41804 RepID=A0A9P6U787_9FUNG|nr:hypothetical protein BG011_000314 [Mortierella polycephala]